MAAPSPTKLQVTPAAAFTEWKEINFQGLYLYRYMDGNAHANQTVILGTDEAGIVVNNWKVCDGTGENAELVALAQGFHVQTGNWLNSFSLVFVNKGTSSYTSNDWFSGSTLEVMGEVVETGDWAVVGGTGQFAMATGVISKKLLQQRSADGGQIIELTIRAFCPVLKGRPRYPVTKIGPFGGTGGSPMDITEAPWCLESITVCTSSVVDSIAFTYLDNSGQKRRAGRWGGSGGQPHTIQLGESEVVTEVSGTVGTNKWITSIKFVTNLNKTYGPWGDGNRKDNPFTFTIPVQPGSGIVGFFARAGGFLDAIGVYVRPL